MLTRIRYGQDATLSLDLSREALVADCAEPHGFPLDDTVAAVQAALADPLDFPPLASMVLPEDRVVVALEEGAVCAPALVAGTVGALVAAGSSPESIRVLRASGDRAIPDSKITSLCDESWRERIEVLEHEPSQRKILSFLATSKEDQPIYVNRELCDADVVLPVGTLHSHDRVGYLGVNHGWFHIL